MYMIKINNENKLKICFDFICDEALVFVNLAEKLNKIGNNAVGFTMGRRWSHGWINKINTYSLDIDVTIDTQKVIDRIANDYASENISGFVQSDRFVSKLSRDKQRIVLANTFINFEKICKDGVDVFITTGVAYLYNLVLLAVSKRYGIPSISLYGTRQNSSSFTYSLGTGAKWDLVAKKYDALDASSNEVRDQIQYVLNFRNKALEPDYMKSVRQAGGLKPIFVREFFTRCKRWYFNGWKSKNDYITQHPVWYAVRDLKRILTKKRLQASFEFDKVGNNEMYFIYPLHLQPEASTLIHGISYVDQLDTIKSIARVLPVNCWLYVKEHPAAFGRNSVEFYGELKKIVNVKLISPNENTQNLIVKSKAVIVISGTMGWEAILLGVPCIVLGGVFYEKFKGAYKVDSVDKISCIFKSREMPAATIKDAARAVAAIKAGSFEGYFDVHKLDTTKKVLAKDNLNLICQGIESILNDIDQIKLS